MIRVSTLRALSLTGALAIVLSLPGSARAQEAAPPQGGDSYTVLSSASVESPAALNANGAGLTDALKAFLAAEAKQAKP